MAEEVQENNVINNEYGEKDKPFINYSYYLDEKITVWKRTFVESNVPPEQMKEALVDCRSMNDAMENMQIKIDEFRGYSFDGFYGNGNMPKAARFHKMGEQILWDTELPASQPSTISTQEIFCVYNPLDLGEIWNNGYGDAFSDNAEVKKD